MFALIGGRPRVETKATRLASSPLALLLLSEVKLGRWKRVNRALAGGESVTDSDSSRVITISFSPCGRLQAATLQGLVCPSWMENALFGRQSDNPGHTLARLDKQTIGDTPAARWRRPGAV